METAEVQVRGTVWTRKLAECDAYRFRMHTANNMIAARSTTHMVHLRTSHARHLIKFLRNSEDLWIPTYPEDDIGLGTARWLEPLS